MLMGWNRWVLILLHNVLKSEEIIAGLSIQMISKNNKKGTLQFSTFQKFPTLIMNISP